MKRLVLSMALLPLAGTGQVLAEGQLRPFQVVGDAIPAPLADRPGDATRGERLLIDRHKSLCLLCHAGPLSEPHAQGTLAPGLSGVGGRLSEGQIRLRVVDMKRLDPDSLMPSNYRVVGLDRVAAPFRGEPVLTAEEIEDVVAFLVTLKE